MYYVNGMYFETLREAIDDAKWLLSMSNDAKVHIFRNNLEFMVIVVLLDDGRFLIERV